MSSNPFSSQDVRESRPWPLHRSLPGCTLNFPVFDSISKREPCFLSLNLCVCVCAGQGWNQDTEMVGKHSIADLHPSLAKVKGILEEES